MLSQARQQLEREANGRPVSDAAVMQQAYDNAMRQYGTGSDLQKAAQAVTGALTALAGNNLAGALASGTSPYLATEIKKRVGEDYRATVPGQDGGAAAGEMTSAQALKNAVENNAPCATAGSFLVPDQVKRQTPRPRTKQNWRTIQRRVIQSSPPNRPRDSL